MFNKRAQAAIEFLMTYGWAILVVLIVIGALAYFGVLSPQRFLPDRCNIGGGQIGCVDFAVSKTSDKIQLNLENRVGDTIGLTEIKATRDANCEIIATSPGYLTGTPQGQSSTANLQLANGRSAVYELTGCGIALQPGDKASVELIITFRRTAGAIDRSVTGDIRATIQ